MKDESVWESNWLSRLDAAVRKSGFTRLLDLAEARESSTLAELIAELGGGFAPVQLEWVMQRELRTQEDLLFFARSMMVRSLRMHCPNGFGRHRDFDKILGITGGVSPLHGKYDDVAQEILTRFKELSGVPDDWVPASVSDPIIQRIYSNLPALTVKRLQCM
jgi:hypothetical protein